MKHQKYIAKISNWLFIIIYRTEEMIYLQILKMIIYNASTTKNVHTF